MTVRWKPLMILSGLFLVVALIGVVALTVAMMPKSSQGILKVARAARLAGRFQDAEIYYKQAAAGRAPQRDDTRGLRRDVRRLDAPGRRREAYGPADRAARPARERVPVRQGGRGAAAGAAARRDGAGPGARRGLLGQGAADRRRGRPRRPLRAGRRRDGGTGAQRPGDPPAPRGAGEGQGPGGAQALDPGAAGRPRRR